MEDALNCIAFDISDQFLFSLVECVWAISPSVLLSQSHDLMTLILDTQDCDIEPLCINR